MNLRRIVDFPLFSFILAVRQLLHSSHVGPETTHHLLLYNCELKTIFAFANGRKESKENIISRLVKIT